MGVPDFDIVSTLNIKDYKQNKNTSVHLVQKAVLFRIAPGKETVVALMNDESEGYLDS